MKNQFPYSLALVGLLCCAFLDWSCKKESSPVDNGPGDCGPALPFFWKTITSGDALSFTSVVSLDNGELLIAGPTTEPSKTKMYIAKLDSDGNFIWKKTYELDKSITSVLLLEDQDGTFYAAGTSIGFNMLAKVDADGNLLWNKDLDYKEIINLQHLPNDLIGVVNNAGEFIRLDKTGQIVSTSYSSASNSVKYLDQDNAYYGAYYQLPHSGPSGTVGPAYIIFKSSANWQTIWKKELSYSYIKPCASTLLDDGTTLVALSKGNPDTDIEVLRIDKNGNSTSLATWDGGNQEWPVDIQQLPDGDILVAVNAEINGAIYPTLLQMSSTGGSPKAFTRSEPAEIKCLTLGTNKCVVVVYGKSGTEGFVWRTDKFGN